MTGVDGARGRDEPVPLRDAVAAVGRKLGMPAPDVFATLTREWPDDRRRGGRSARVGAFGS